MPASRYDIYAEQGTTFKLYMDYKYAGSTGINLNGFSGAMQIRRSAKEDNVLLYLTTTGVTAGLYGGTGNTVSISVDAQGRITAAANVASTGGAGVAGAKTIILANIFHG